MRSHLPVSSKIGDYNTALFKDAFYPLVSIGMPVFNCEKTLTIAIRSILNQTYDNWELLLLDDGSTDRTLEVARSFDDPRISVLTDHSHKGLVPRLDQAIEISRGEYFARMDGDDVAYPERLELQTKYLEQHPEVDLLGCGMLVFKGDGVVVGSRPAPETHEEICRRPWAGFHLYHPTWMGRMEWFRKHRYRPEAIRAEDQDLLLRTYQTSRFAALKTILLGYREDSLSLSKILLGRRTFTRSTVLDAVSKNQYPRAATSVLEQLLKAAIDIMAIGTGLNYHLLRQRALPADEVVKERWSQMWSVMTLHCPVHQECLRRDDKNQNQLTSAL
jgi:glycosyltransferase involved in cell wall biosynthesis